MTCGFSHYQSRAWENLSCLLTGTFWRSLQKLCVGYPKLLHLGIIGDRCFACISASVLHQVYAIVGSPRYLAYEIACSESFSIQMFWDSFKNLVSPLMFVDVLVSVLKDVDQVLWYRSWWLVLGGNKACKQLCHLSYELSHMVLNLHSGHFIYFTSPPLWGEARQTFYKHSRSVISVLSTTIS